MSKRTTRKRKGGKCGDIKTYGDYKKCIRAECDKHACAAEYRKESQSHKLIGVEDDILAQEMAKLEIKKNDARKDRQTRRRKLRMASETEPASYASPMQIQHAEQKSFNAFVNSLDTAKKYVIANEPEHHDRLHVSTTPIATLMTNDSLATEFEADCFDKLPLDVRSTISPKMREASVKQFESLMPQLLKNYNASVVGHRRD